MKDEMKDQVARVLGQIPSGCFVLTAAHNGKSTGILASWVQQASFDPPIVTVAVKHGRHIRPLIEGSGHFVLNTIGEESNPMFKHFAKGFEPGQDAFSGLETRAMPAGIVLDQCIGHMACKLVGHIDAGDHRVFLGQIIAGAAHRPGEAHVHVRANGFKY